MRETVGPDCLLKLRRARELRSSGSEMIPIHLTQLEATAPKCQASKFVISKPTCFVSVTRCLISRRKNEVPATAFWHLASRLFQTYGTLRHYNQVEYPKSFSQARSQ